MCIGCGLCAGIASDVFEISGSGKAEAVEDATTNNIETVIEAVESCPVSAISEIKRR